MVSDTRLKRSVQLVCNSFSQMMQAKLHSDLSNPLIDLILKESKQSLAHQGLPVAAGTCLREVNKEEDERLFDRGRGIGMMELSPSVSFAPEVDQMKAGAHCPVSTQPSSLAKPNTIAAFREHIEPAFQPNHSYSRVAPLLQHLNEASQKAALSPDSAFRQGHSGHGMAQSFASTTEPASMPLSIPRFPRVKPPMPPPYPPPGPPRPPPGPPGPPPQHASPVHLLPGAAYTSLYQHPLSIAAPPYGVHLPIGGMAPAMHSAQHLMAPWVYSSGAPTARRAAMPAVALTGAADWQQEKSAAVRGKSRRSRQRYRGSGSCSASSASDTDHAAR